MKLLRPREAGTPAASTAALTEEIELACAEADKRLLAVHGIKQASGISAVFFLGDAGAAKTTLIAEAGIDAELLVAHESAPTRALNFWYSHSTLFVDPAGAIMADPVARKRLFGKFQARQGITASRSVVLAVDCDNFLQPGSAEALPGKAREFQTILAQLSRETGASLPVYVVFTKADKIPYFRDFIKNLTEQEAAEILGATLPLPAAHRAQRLAEAFQKLYYFLIGQRAVCLARERNPANLPNIYEHPREFGKLRPLLVQFLADICRPSQLGKAPFLRGFYFVGLRTAAAEADSGGAPQWVFLRQLIPNVILADRQATRVVNSAQRLLLTAAALSALCLAIWWIISYRNNRLLVKDAVAATRALAAASLPSDRLASLDSLQRLTRVRNTLAGLDGFEENGVPLSYGGFLYSGSAIREALLTEYYASFRRLLLAPAQETLIEICSRPGAARPNDYRYVYDSLKAYLITTSNNEISTAGFLAPALLRRWKKDKPIDAEREKLALQNFEFYAQELAEGNPYPQFSTPDSAAVASAREYLAGFRGTERIYQAMLTTVGEGRQAIVFNTDYPGSSDTVINTFKVEAPFTKPGFDAFQKLLEMPDKYPIGEEWVLGPLPSDFDKALAVAIMPARYQQDFIKTWTEYLEATKVKEYESVPDAAGKLLKLSSPASPLLQVLCVASENTAVGVKEVAQAFQAIQFVTPPGCLQTPIGQGNRDYMEKLAALQAALQRVGPIEKADPVNAMVADDAAEQSETAAKALLEGFKTGQTVSDKTARLLLDPITPVQPLLKSPGAGAVNAAAADVCKSISGMLGKYPFDSNSRNDATLQELNGFLKPRDGSLWQLYNNSLKQFLQPAGDGFETIPGQQLNVTPDFLKFFNQAIRLSRALYQEDGAQGPNLTFSVAALPSQTVDRVTLSVDGQILSGDPNTHPKQTFRWPGVMQNATLQVRVAGGSDLEVARETGLWAPWRFIQRAERSPGIAKFELDPQSARILQSQYFSGLACAGVKAVE